MTIDWNKPIQQRNGDKAEIVCTDLAGSYPVLVVITDKVTGNKHHTAVRQNGKYRELPPPCALPGDIINVPERREWFINYYPNDNYAPYLYKTLEKANNAASKDRIGPARKLIIEGKRIWIEEV